MTERAKRWPQGEWTAHKQDGRPGHCFMAQVFDADGNALAAIEPRVSPDEGTATAQLLKAAPRLVEALEQSVQSMLDSGYNPKSVVVREAQAALDVAYGEVE